MTSQYNPAHPLTRLKSEKFGIRPTELPLPKRKRARKSPKGSDNETLSSTSSISTSPPRSQPSTPPPQTIFNPPSGIPTTPPQSSAIIVTSASQLQGSFSANPLVSSSSMEQSPWNNPGEVLMPAPLSQIPAHPEKRLPRSILRQAC